MSSRSSRILGLLALFLLSLAIAFTQSERQRLQYKGFGGGLYTLADHTRCLPTQLLKASNVVVGDAGEIKTRPALVQLTSTGNGFESNTRPYAFIRTTKDHVFLADQVEVKCLSGDGTERTIRAEDCRNTNFVVFDGNLLFFTNNITSGVLFTPANAIASAVVATGSPPTECLCIHNNRVFAGRNTVVYETAVGSSTGWADGEAWDIDVSGASGNDKIIGMGSLRGVLYIFFKTRIFRMTGYSPEERRIELFTGSYGAAHQRAIVPCEITGMGEALVFYSFSKKLCLLTESGVQEINESVPMTLSDPVAAFGTSLRQLWIVDTNSTPWQTGYVVGFDQPYQSQFGTRWPITQLSCPDISASDSFISVAPAEPTSVAGYGDTGQILAAAQTRFGSGSTTCSIVYTAPAVGADTYYDYASGALQVRNIHSTIQTRHEDAGDERALKGWKKAFFWMSGTNPPVATISQVVNYKTATATMMNPAVEAIASRSYLNLYNWGARNSLTLQMVTGSTWTLHEVDLDYVTGAKFE